VQLKPKLDAPILAAFGVSAVIFASSFAIGLVGAYLLVIGWPNLGFLVGSVLCFAVAWVLRPRFGISINLLSREDYPALFGLVHGIAEKLAIAPINSIQIDHEFNASIMEIGIRRHPVLTIGLPVWVSLDSQERVALIAHELAHRANGDPGRSSIIGSALGMLNRWRYILEPVSYGEVDLGLLIAHFFMRIAGGLVVGLQRILLSLLYIDSQKAEYLADYLAAKIAGVPAALSLLHKLRLGENLTAVAERVYYRGDTDGRSVIEAFRAFCRAVPAREMERIRRANDKEEHASMNRILPPPTVFVFSRAGNSTSRNSSYRTRMRPVSTRSCAHSSRPAR
jgi:Zn-dependent protease with chaperone function